MDQRNYRNVLLISLSQFGLAFSFNFVMVFLPFFIHNVSPYPSSESLIWIGLIMAAPSFLSALFSTFWGSLTNRISPKILYMRGLISHSIIIFLMAFVTSLPILLVLRIVQGILGGISTVGLVIVSASSNRQHSSRDIGLFQNSLTLGQLVGPPIGALAASMLGYKGAFISASSMIFLTLVFCFFCVSEVPRNSREGDFVQKRMLNRQTLIGWGLCFAASVQLMFLPSVLPNVFQAFRFEQTAALKRAGFVVMSYTATAMIGTYFLCRLAARIPIKRLIGIVCLFAVVLQASLSVSHGLFSFVVIRMLHAGVVASIPPLMFSIAAANLDARAIGFLNSGRFAGNALGPLVATCVLAFSSLTWLYLTIASIALAAFLSFVLFFTGAADGIGEGNVPSVRGSDSGY